MTEKDEAANEMTEEEAAALLDFMEKSSDGEAHVINVDDSVPPEKPTGSSKYPTPVVPSPVVPRRDSPVAVPKQDGPLNRTTPFHGDPGRDILRQATGTSGEL